MDFAQYLFGISIKDPETVARTHAGEESYSPEFEPQSSHDKLKGGAGRGKMMMKAMRSETTEDEYDLEEHMLEEHTYPSPTQENFQEAIYNKRDYYIHKIPEQVKVSKENRVEEFRKLCKPDSGFRLSDTQILLSNFINPDTPYKGVLIFWGTGVGKTCAAVAIAEKFKPMVEKYGTRILVLVPGPLNRQNFLKEIIKCSGDTYNKIYQDRTAIMGEGEKAKMRKMAINLVNQYYRIMSYRSFYKKVLGEKIRERMVTGDKVKIYSRKTDTGEYERDVSADRIYNLDNTLLIADEAHNLTGNEYDKAIKSIIEKSKNLKVVLLSATPMKDKADDIIDLINYLRPPAHPIVRDKVFTSQRDWQMDFKPGGVDYLRNMVRGYVSYLRGADPITFAKRIDVGEIPPGLSFTKVTRCFMLPFQLEVYRYVVESTNDSLDRRSEAAANFVFPGLPKDKLSTEIEGYYGIEGISDVRNQLKNHARAVGQRLAKTVLADYKIEDPASLIYLTDNNKVISGDIFNILYLKYFSIKFYTALTRINETVYGKRGPGLSFVYSNLVRVGVEVFQQVLQHNGYLEFQENASSYILKRDTKCYYCDHTYGDHSRLPESIPKHDFFPATYVSFTGKSDDSADQIPEEKHRVLDNVFNTSANADGKYIKVIIGSRVMNEGITLKNIKDIHVLDVHYNLGKVDQVIGRGIRYCTHYDIISPDLPYPEVEINKYVVSMDSGLTTEEQLYQKAEQKYTLIKRTERILQEEAIDCPLNRNGNIFQSELEKYRNCGSKENPCPAICGYMQCEYKCGDKFLNAKYYDPDRGIYRKVSNSDLDYSTYTNSLATDEIDHAKTKVKEMYGLNNIYTLNDILKYVRKSYPPDKRSMFDDFYVYRGLNDLIPITGNDFNNFHDTITDKYNRAGYLIYRESFYIFQPFDEPEELPVYYRTHFRPAITNKLSIKNYVHNTTEYRQYKQDANGSNPDSIVTPFATFSYDFDSGREYYDSREEFEIVGIIDRESPKRKNRQAGEFRDEFKIRPTRPKILEKKRKTGVPSLLGAVCANSKNKEELLDNAAKVNLDLDQGDVRTSICDALRDKLFDMEKYATAKAGNKLTYMMVPSNHPVIPFPLNLEDRIRQTLDNIKHETRVTIDPKITTKPVPKPNRRFTDINYVTYTIEFDTSMNKFADILKKYGATKTGPKWVIEFN
ncbi:NTPase [uncultured virus]|nr:NTPase [uncultured virus]